MIVILDFGSQYSELIARRVREAKVYSEVLPCNVSLETIKSKNPVGIILSGGPNSIFQENAPSCNPDIFDWGIPVLGICYGMQLMAHSLGGLVKTSEKHEYGAANLVIDGKSILLEGIPEKASVWMSHGDSVEVLPDGFKILAHTDTCPVALMCHESKPLLGIQFHPEVVHSEYGTQMLQNFLYKICHCEADWTPQSFLDSAVQLVKEKVGDKKVLCALSGGVDSSVVAALLHHVIGDQLTCMYIDQGFMRANESENIKKLFEETFHINLIMVNVADRFFEAIKGVTDPELKRKRIGNEFVRVFEEESEKLQGEFTFLAQGTLYSDVIESAVMGSLGQTVTIKTHHNVGGLPKDMKFKVLEPLRSLFKDEVRALGLELGLPEELVYRQPFPGPGLAIRILGEVTRERVKLLQHADRIVLEEIKKANYYRKVWQSFAVLLPIKSVGVMGDKRTYQSTIALRIVNSQDAMTANWTKVPYEILEAISSRILNEVEGVNRVVYDISSKPPSTIEWE